MTVKHNYRGLVLLFFLTAFHFAGAQILEPCHWSFRVEQTKPDEATLILTAKLDSGWHLYSQFLVGDGPVPTHFGFNKSPYYKLIGKTEEGKALSEYDKNFDMELKYFADVAVFKQKVTVLSKNDFTITGAIDYQVCKEECIFPPAEEFTIKVKGNPEGKDLGAAQEIKPDTQAIVPPVNVPAQTSEQGAENYSSTSKKSLVEMRADLEAGCGEEAYPV